MPFVENQGDAWTVTAAYLDRFVDEQRLLAASEHARESEEQVSYLRYMSQTGRRVAEMHVALASRKDFPISRRSRSGASRRPALDRRCDRPRRARLRHAEATRDTL
jgi:predicted trehalose synthase